MNVLDLVRKHGIEPKRVSSSKGGEFASPCPGCGGEDRFRIWPDQDDGGGTWWCRQCDKGGDGIQFLREYEGLSYQEACVALGKEVGKYEGAPRRPFHRAARRPKPEWHPTEYTCPADLWRTKAAAFVDRAHAYLMGEHAGWQRKWLADRGIGQEAAVRCRLGWNPGKEGKDMWRPRESWGLPTEVKDDGRKKKLWLPIGLVIPYFIGDDLQRIRIRRWADTGPRYYVVPGSGMAPMLLGDGRRGYVVVETELDGILVEQLAGDLVGALAMGSSSAKPDARSHRSLAEALCILNALDFDAAGAKAWQWWADHYARAERWPVPTGKDPGEAYQAGVDIRAWVTAGLPPGLTIGRSPFGLEKKGVADVVSSDGDGAGVGPQPEETAPESVVELFNLLRVSPVKIRDGFTIDENQGWVKRHWEASKRISYLVFKDQDVRDHIDSHPSNIIHGGNFWPSTR